jgi:hypothetical protein
MAEFTKLTCLNSIKLSHKRDISPGNKGLFSTPCNDHGMNVFTLTNFSKTGEQLFKGIVIEGIQCFRTVNRYGGNTAGHIFFYVITSHPSLQF